MSSTEQTPTTATKRIPTTTNADKADAIKLAVDGEMRDLARLYARLAAASSRADMMGDEEGDGMGDLEHEIECKHAAIAKLRVMAEEPIVPLG